MALPVLCRSLPRDRPLDYASLSWSSLFITMAGMGVLVCLLSVFVLQETHNKTLMPSAEHSHSSEPTTDAQIAATESFYERFFLSRLLISAIAVTAILTFVNTSPMLIMNTMGFSRGEYSTTMALTALVSMLTSFAMPFALSFFHQRRLNDCLSRIICHCRQSYLG